MAPRRKNYGFDLPEELSRALASDKTARILFDRLPEPNQRAYAASILEARHPATRVLKAAGIVERLSAGFTMP